MHIYRVIELSIDEKLKFVDITSQARDFVREAIDMYGGKGGFLNVYTLHTTSAIRVNENEPRLISDFKRYLEGFAPESGCYGHDDIDKRDCPPDERINGHSHIKSLYLGSSECIPVRDGKLHLGVWQSIFYVDLDGGNRKRQVCLDLICEKGSNNI